MSLTVQDHLEIQALRGAFARLGASVCLRVRVAQGVNAAQHLLRFFGGS